MTLPKKIITLLFIIFTVSRLFIYLTPPLDYSDVRADYERYAHMWSQGHWPYLKHKYEYPPASVPILYFPLFLYHNGIGDYYKNYRAQTLVFDIAFFVFLTLTVNKRLNWNKDKKFTSLYLYIFLSTFTRAFLYEGIDLIFTATIMTAYLLPLWFKKNSSWARYLKWILFWLSTAIKFLTLPLMVPIFVIGIAQKNLKLNLSPKNCLQLFKNKIFMMNFKKELLAFLIGFVLIWGPPIAVFRENLLVSFTFNFGRPIKYAAFPAYIIKTANYFTNSEQQNNFPPDYEWQGHIADKVTEITTYAFPTIMLLYLWWSLRTVNKASDEQEPDKFFLSLKIHIVYIFTLFLSAKTFSQPFHIWYLPALSLLAIQSEKRKWLTVLSVIMMMLIDVTELFHLPTLDNWEHYLDTVIRDSLRFIPMFALLIGTAKLKNSQTNRKDKESCL